MPSIGPLELIAILLVVLLLFGSTRLPKLARSMGEASREFKKGVSEKEQGELTSPSDEKVTMSRAELDALLAEREARSPKDVPPSA